MLREQLKLMLDVFSRRHGQHGRPSPAISERLRTKILLLCRDVFSNTWRSQPGRGDYTEEFWVEIHRALEYVHGRARLLPNTRANTPAEDAIQFLLSCETQEFLDFVELMFKVDCLFHVTNNDDDLVDAVNELFRSEGAPYQLIPFVKQEEDASGPPPFHGGKVIRTIAYPTVVRVDEEATFTHAILPTLAVLADPAYQSANLEFREALEDYRKGDYGDCLTKCGSAFESVMKVICAKKGWPFTPHDTAAPLLRTILSNAGMESFFEHPLVLIATLRNRLSKAHGAGPGTRRVRPHIAEFAIATTAASIMLLIRETN